MEGRVIVVFHDPLESGDNQDNYKNTRVCTTNIFIILSYALFEYILDLSKMLSAIYLPQTG